MTLPSNTHLSKLNHFFDFFQFFFLLSPIPAATMSKSQSGCTHDHIQYETQEKVSSDAIDFSDPALKEAFDDVLNDKTSTNWLLFKYAKGSNALKVHETGDDGLKGLVDDLSDGAAMYGFLKKKTEKGLRSIYITWAPSGVPTIRKGLLNSHAYEVGKWFKSYHLQINARNEEDLEEDVVDEKLRRGAGASY
eukprot:GCRY01001167.1.p1 GENE.GCRY01001167.1~~GCRY01001167.1.p1  ORF type:complete len:192 (+),score=45.62 GCRY01001167.1:798-1373(+)